VKTEDLIKTLVQNAKPVRPVSSVSNRIFWWLVLTFFATTLGVSLFGLRSDITEKLSDARFLFEIAILFIIAVGSAIGALILSVPAQDHRAFTRWLPLTGMGLWLFLIFARILGSDALHLDCAFSCIRDIAIIGLIPAAFLVWMIKRTAPTHLRLTATLLLLAGSAIGCIGVQLLCKSDEALHGLLWHALPALSFGALGLVLGRRLLRW